MAHLAFSDDAHTKISYAQVEAVLRLMQRYGFMTDIIGNERAGP